MKKIKNIFILTIFVAILVLLIGCENNAEPDTNSTDGDRAGEQSTDNTNNTIIDGEGINDEMTNRKDFHFDNYQEFKNWVYASENPERDEESLEDNYLEFIQEVLVGESDIYIPTINGNPANLREKQGHNMTIFEYDFLKLPWVWYDLTYDTCNNIIIKQALITKEKRNVNNLSTSDYIELLYPGAVNIFNMEKYPHYEEIREEIINVGGNEVLAVYYQVSDDARVKYSFTFNEYLFIVWADKELFNSDFLENLSFIPLSEYKDQ